MKKLFIKLPFFIKFILINIYGYYLKKIRFNKKFFKNLNYYLEKDYTEKKYFNKELFYEQIEDNNFYEKKDITEYGLINKTIIKKYYDDIINNKYKFTQLTTSGSTGSGLVFPISKEFIEQQWAIFWKFRYIHGLNTDSWCANFISQSMFTIDNDKYIYIKSYGTKQLLISQYHVKNSTLLKILNKIKQSNIFWIHAFPSILTTIASLIKDNNLKHLALDLNIKIITTSSEKLHKNQKFLIEDIFNCKVRELYGLTEGVVNIFECEKSTLHVDESYSFVEFIPTEHDEKEYKIIGTSYFNKAFPLVRYETGDTCILYEKNIKCKCGRNSRIIKEILGRDEDYIILNNNHKIGRLSSIFKNLTEIKESQIYQKELGKAIFRIVKNKEYNEKSEENLKKEIIEKLGKNFEFEITYLDSIPKTKRGKLKFVISEINE